MKAKHKLISKVGSKNACKWITMVKCMMIMGEDDTNCQKLKKDTQSGLIRNY
ncbi:hypothetical protein HSE3_gp038 [Bacillus phage vB_BceM-HSE3]|nr:hypothetical protein HSE3_gp038 [Bacillus phage vB_BceM-HSE3]